MKKPLYSLYDEVIFEFDDVNETIECHGHVFVVDPNGTFEQHEEPSYDIFVDNWKGSGEQTLVKHVRQSQIKTKITYENSVPRWQL